MKPNLLFIIAIISVVGVSCVPYSYYTSSPHQVPMFEEKGEFSAQGTASSNGLLDLQAAYAITSHIAVMGGGALNVSKPVSPADRGSGNHFNLAAGYFSPLLEGNTIFQIYGGAERGAYNFGYTSYDHYDHAYVDNGTAQVVFNKFYLMPSLGYTHSLFDIAFSLRVGHLSFPVIENSIIDENSYEYLVWENDRNIKSTVRIEPAITWRIGWEHVKLQAQMGWSFYKSDISRIDFFGGDLFRRHFYPTYFNVGLYFIITNRYKNEFTP